MTRLTLSELAQQGNTDAIANLIKQSIAANANAVGAGNLAFNDLNVDAELSDGRLSLNLIAPESLNQQKIMALIHSQLGNLKVKSITRVKVYGWLKDSELPEQRLSWNQEFKLEPPVKSPKHQSQSAMPAPSLRGIAANNPASVSVRSAVKTNGMATANAVPPITSRSTDVPIPRQGANGANPNNVGNAGMASAAHNSGTASIASTQPIDLAGANSATASGNVAVKRKKSVKMPVQLILIGIFIAIAGMGMGMGIRVITALSQQSSLETESTNPQPSDLDDPAALGDPTANPDDLASEQPEDLKITLTEFEKINQGMTIEEVEAIIGEPGKLIANSKVGDVSGQVYSWKNSKGSNAIIEFRNGKVVAKAQAGLS
jgi:hypothetical protein